MIVRHAAAGDADAIARLHASSWRDTYRNALSRAYLDGAVLADMQALWSRRLARPAPNQTLLVACDDGGLAGFACAFAGEDPGWGSYLDNLHVDSRARGQGLGATLLREAAAACRLRVPGRGLYLSVNQDNEAAQGFYRRLGGRNAGVDVWHAPDGSEVPIYWFTWATLDELIAAVPGRARP